GGDDLVARLDAEGHEHQPQRIGARVDAHGVLHPEVLGQLLLEAAPGRAHHVLIALQHRQDGVVDLLLDAVVLADMAVKWNLDFGHWCDPFLAFVFYFFLTTVTLARENQWVRCVFLRWPVSAQMAPALCLFFATYAL